MIPTRFSHRGLCRSLHRMHSSAVAADFEVPSVLSDMNVMADINSNIIADINYHANIMQASPEPEVTPLENLERVPQPQQFESLLPSYTYKVIEPRWQIYDEPVPRNSFTIDCSGEDMTYQNPRVVDRILKTFEDTGIVHLVNTGLFEHSHMREWVNVLIKQQAEYTGGANPRKPLEPNVYDVGAPLSAWLHYHHEMVYVSRSPSLLGIWCKYSPVKNSGATYFSCNNIATKAILQTELGEKLKAKDICYVRNLTDKEYYQKHGQDESQVYNHWQDSFDTNDMQEAEKVAHSRGLKTEWVVNGTNRYLKTKYYTSAFEYCPIQDRNVLYSSLADDFMWFDNWPGVMNVPVNDRPLKFTYGDDSELTQEEKQTFIDVYDQGGFPINWKQGEIVIACNYRYAHGRPAIKMEEGDKRELGVVFGGTFDRVGVVEGKW